MTRIGSQEVCKLLRVTPRQVQTWDETGLLRKDLKDGHKRKFSEWDVDELRLIADMRHRGISLQRVRGVMSLIRKKRLLDESGYLLTDGKTVWHANSPTAAITRLKCLKARVLLVELHPKAKIL